MYVMELAESRGYAILVEWINEEILKADKLSDLTRRDGSPKKLDNNDILRILRNRETKIETLESVKRTVNDWVNGPAGRKHAATIAAGTAK